MVPNSSPQWVPGLLNYDLRTQIDGPACRCYFMGNTSSKTLHPNHQSAHSIILLFWFWSSFEIVIKRECSLNLFKWNLDKSSYWQTVLDMLRGQWRCSCLHHTRKHDSQNENNDVICIGSFITIYPCLLWKLFPSIWTWLTIISAKLHSS